MDQRDYLCGGEDEAGAPCFCRPAAGSRYCAVHEPPSGTEAADLAAALERVAALREITQQALQEREELRLRCAALEAAAAQRARPAAKTKRPERRRP